MECRALACILTCGGTDLDSSGCQSLLHYFYFPQYEYITYCFVLSWLLEGICRSGDLLIW